MQQQIDEIFPEGIAAHIAAQKQKSKTEFVPMLDELIAAIKNASDEDLKAALHNECNNSELYLVLNKFRAAFTDLSHSEKIFNPHYLLAAFEACVDKFDWNNLVLNKLVLFWSQVIGFVQRFLPATYAQAFAYSLVGIVEYKHTGSRSFNSRFDSGFSFYPLAISFSGLGFNYAAYSGRDRQPEDLSKGVKCRQQLFQNLCRTKNSKLSELITRRRQSTHCCIIQ
jgi:hypothetical protein